MLIIDAYNVLHAAGKVHADLGGLTLPGLVRLIQAGRWSGGPVAIVCDGTGTRTGVDASHTHSEAPVRVVFAGPGKDADAAIVRLIEEQEYKGRAGALTIVSSDKGVLASAIGPVGAKPKRMTSERFVRMLLEDATRAGTRDLAAGAARPDALDTHSVQHWLKQFGLDAVEPRTGEDPRSLLPRRPSETPTPSTPPVQQDWPDGIDPDDLDMGKWLGENGSRKK